MIILFISMWNTGQSLGWGQNKKSSHLRHSNLCCLENNKVEISIEQINIWVWKSGGVTQVRAVNLIYSIPVLFFPDIQYIKANCIINQGLSLKNSYKIHNCSPTKEHLDKFYQSVLLSSTFLSKASLCGKYHIIIHFIGPPAF